MNTPMPMRVQPLTLSGHHVRLEPLSLAHVDALAAVGLDPVLWRHVPSRMESAEDMRDYVGAALAEQARGVSLPFAMVEQASSRVIGSTRYGNIVAEHRRLEIGWTWLTPGAQRTGANTEAKLLLLAHAFETLGANRVELKTDALNAQSRAAIQRIGATQEGIFRQHMVIPGTGRIRDTVYFSIIRAEWPAVKANLQARLRR
jgi:N-acetyltransferase